MSGGHPYSASAPEPPIGPASPSGSSTANPSVLSVTPLTHRCNSTGVVCVRLDGLADQIAEAMHAATCDFGSPCITGPSDKDDARASAVLSLLRSLAVQ